MKLHDTGVYLVNGVPQTSAPAGVTEADAKKGTIAYGILKAHNTGDSMQDLRMKFDSMTSHDITYVGIIQTARASGMTEFPLPYVMTNCHNSLCAVGGTINEDDHQFALSAAHKYGGIYVPPNMAVIHSYNREMMSGCGRMILGSDSHTRYGALGTMAVGEGGGELAKQLLGRTYDFARPQVIAIYLTGKPRPGIGPHDVALSICGAVYKKGYVKNKVMEFVGPGIKSMTTDYRNGVDVMTTETTCLTSVWCTDDDTKAYLAKHGRADDYRELKPADVTYYDGLVYVDLSTVKPMIALPFHPSNAFEIDELNANLGDILREVEKEAARLTEGKDIEFSLTDKITPKGLQVQQGIIAGCAGGTYTNVMAAAHILKGAQCGQGEFTLDVYPSSQPVFMDLLAKGAISDLMATGAIVKTAFCGPCFGAGDTPANNAFSIRHSTRNFPNREGSKLQKGQIASVALMDARSIAATAANKGYLTAATDCDVEFTGPTYHFDKTIYANRVFDSKGVADPDQEIQFGPNIKDWPEMVALPENLIIKVVSEIHDPVTTTDELIPSGETSSFRSNPLGLAEFALSRKDPAYVGRAKEVQKAEKAREAGQCMGEALPELRDIMHKIKETYDVCKENVGVGSTIFAVKPGDGSAREQAASCQKVLGGWANIANEYATKRYRSNLINWGMLPFIIDEGGLPFTNGDYIFIPEIAKAVKEKTSEVKAYVVNKEMKEFTLRLGELTDDERQIILDGCLINFYRNHQ